MEKHYEIKKTINKIIREKKRFPSLQEMCNILHYTENQTKKYMQALVEDGYLEKIGDWYKFPKKKENIFHYGNAAVSVDDEGNRGKVVSALNKGLDIQEKAKEYFGEGQTVTMAESHGAVDPVQGNTEGSNPSLPKKDNQLTLDKLDELIEPVTKPRWIKMPDKIDKLLGGKIRKTFRRQQKKPKKSSEYSAPIYIIQILMGAIGIGASIISIYYTAVWLIEFLPLAFALLLSSIMVGFAVSAFEAIILFLSGQVTQSRITKISITTGFIILWIVVTSFSISSTIAGQYNKFVRNLQEQTRQGVDSGKANWILLQERKEDIKKNLSEQRDQLDIHKKALSGVDDIQIRSENEQAWNEIQYRIRKTNDRIRELSDEMNNIRKEEQKQLSDSKEKGIILSSNASEKVLDFYGWFAKVLGVDRDRTQFFMSLLPAVFVDIISPVSLAISLFLRKKYKKH